MSSASRGGAARPRGRREVLVRLALVLLHALLVIAVGIAAELLLPRIR